MSAKAGIDPLANGPYRARPRWTSTMSEARHLKLHGYARDGLPGIPLAEQEAQILSSLPSVASVRVDRLNRTQARRHRYADLKVLHDLLEEAGPRSGVAVVDIAALGWTAGDVCRSMTAILRSGSRLYITSDDRSICPETSCVDFLPLLTSYLQSERGSPSTRGREAAIKASAEKRAEDRDRRLVQARPLWRDSTLTIAQISRQVGLSPRALHKHLGPRSQRD